MCLRINTTWYSFDFMLLKTYNYLKTMVDADFCIKETKYLFNKRMK